MDKTSKNSQANTSIHRDALPLELNESLKIRDGLVSPQSPAVDCPKFKVIGLPIPGQGHFWVSYN